MIKKIITLILACTMMLANCTVLLANTIKTTLRIETVQSADKGSTFNVNIYLDHPKDLKTLEFSLMYNPEVLTLNKDSITWGSGFDEWEKESNLLANSGAFYVAAVDEDGFTNNKSAKIASMEFAVNKSASIGNTTLELKDLKGYVSETEGVEVKGENGYINITTPSTTTSKPSTSTTETKHHKVTATTDEQGMQVATVSKEVFVKLAEQEGASLTITGEQAEVVFDQASLQHILGQAAGELKLEIQTIKPTQSAYPIYEMKLSVDDKNISDFGKGKVKVTVPCEVAPADDSLAMVVYHIQDETTGELMKQSTYDNGTMTFTTNHFSYYTVAENKTAFTDVSGWYEDYVTYLAAREVMKGRTATTFAPNASITRAELVQILANLEGELDSSNTVSFADVNKDAWYANSVAWAAANGIATGYEGNFNPNAPITRQELAVMLVRYCENVAQTTLKQTTAKVTFNDEAQIASYAKEAVSALQQAEIISGKDNNIFDPTAQATRAEVAKMIAVFMSNN